MILSKKSVFGYVMWWRERDREGVIKDLNGKEYFFNHSFLQNKDEAKIIKRKVPLRFYMESFVNGSVCASSVRLIAEKTSKMRFVLHGDGV